MRKQIYELDKRNMIEKTEGTVLNVVLHGLCAEDITGRT